MIKSLKIRNFQSLRNVDLTFGGFNVILGESDIGKSAVVRSIRAVLENATGKTFISHGEKETTIGIQFDDCEVLWRKGAKTAYGFKQNGQTSRFDSPGHGMPDEIKEVVKMGRIEVGGAKLDVNVHGQLDSPFLLTKPWSES